MCCKVISEHLGRGVRVMDKAAFENKLRELASEFGAFESHYEKLANTAQEQKTNPDMPGKENFDALEDSLDFLKVCVKYMRFDLDATHRENQYLRKLLEDLNG
jgi:hypothetical protein